MCVWHFRFGVNDRDVTTQRHNPTTSQFNVNNSMTSQLNDVTICSTVETTIRALIRLCEIYTLKIYQFFNINTQESG